MKEFPRLFTGLGAIPGLFSVELKENTKLYHLLSPRPTAVGLYDKAKMKVEKMLALVFIEP